MEITSRGPKDLRDRVTGCEVDEKLKRQCRQRQVDRLSRLRTLSKAMPPNRMDGLKQP